MFKCGPRKPDIGTEKTEVDRDQEGIRFKIQLIQIKSLCFFHVSASIERAKNEGSGQTRGSVRGGECGIMRQKIKDSMFQEERFQMNRLQFREKILQSTDECFKN